MRFLIIHNLASGLATDAVFEFERCLLKEDDECCLRCIGKQFHLAQALRDAESFDLLVLSGGDGTVANLLWRLKDTELPLCVFPSGTANLLFANIGCAPEPAAIAHACRMLKTSRVDLGELTWTAQDSSLKRCGFSVMAGLGYDASLMQAAIPNKQAFGQAAYFLAALANPLPTVAHFTIDIDGRRIERDGISCLVANTAKLQGDIEMIPNCRMDDGLLDVIMLTATNVSQLVRPILVGIVDPKGKNLRRPKLETWKASRVHIVSSKPLPLQYDGNVCEEEVMSYSAGICPGALSVIVDPMSPYYSGAQA